MSADPTTDLAHEMKRRHSSAFCVCNKSADIRRMCGRCFSEAIAAHLSRSPEPLVKALVTKWRRQDEPNPDVREAIQQCADELEIAMIAAVQPAALAPGDGKEEK